MEEPGSRSAEAAGLRIDAVEVLPTDLRAVLLRVAGAWEGPPPEHLAAPVLVLGEADRRHRIDSLPETSGAAARAAPETQPFRAAFSVPDALAPLLDESIELDLGPLTVRLPAPTPLGEEADPGEMERTVFDPAVLAERRARRAELADEANLRRPGEAEHGAGQLEGELGKLELRLAAAAEERAGLEARLAAREDEARDAEELRGRLREADERAQRLSRDLEAMRHRADEAERTAPELDARSRELQERADAVARAEEETRTARAELTQAMARATALRRELLLLRRELEVPGAGDVARLQAEATERASALAAAERAIAAARDTVAVVQETLERERAERAAAEAELRERLARERAELEGRVAALERRERELSKRVDAELSARRAAEAELEATRARIEELERSLAEHDGREAERAAAHRRLEQTLEELGAELRSARAAAEHPARDPALSTIEGALADLRTALERTGTDFEAALEAERARTRAAQARADAAAQRQARAERRVRASQSPWLEDALRRLARADRTAAARLALQLLPGQALAVTGPLDYDVDAVGLGRHRIAVRPGSAEPAAPIARWRRVFSGFRIVATPAGLVKLVIGGGAASPAGVRAAGTLRRRRALRRLPAVPLRLGALAQAGVLPDPGLLYRALAAAIDPEWTRGHRFTIALEIAGPRGGTWHVSAADGAPLAVDEAPPGSAADAVVRTSQVGLQHLLDGEAPPTGEKAALRGDASAIGLLGRWSDRARGLGGARNVRD